MSLPLALVLLSYGIALTQAASDSRAVTLAWLRLGDLISLSLLGIAGATLLMDPPIRGASALNFICPLLAGGTFVHLVLVQSGRRRAERLVIALTCAAMALVFILPYLVEPLAWMQALNAAPTGSDALATPAWPQRLIGLALALAACLTGGSLMTMLLGHAYLTAASEMTQQPFLRLTALLLAALVMRLALALSAGLWPWWSAQSASHATGLPMVPIFMIATRFLMGILVPLIMTWMARQCVRIRSNQSATGILYVSSTMILVGEFLGLTLVSMHGLPF